MAAARRISDSSGGAAAPSSTAARASTNPAAALLRIRRDVRLAGHVGGVEPAAQAGADRAAHVRHVLVDREPDAARPSGAARAAAGSRCPAPPAVRADLAARSDGEVRDLEIDGAARAAAATAA